jgi:aminomethyltransferase
MSELAGARRTPLYDRHVALGARIVPFGGWAMPLQYDGIVAEHKRCRAAAGLFDVSHMGQLRLTGSGALQFLQRALTNTYADLAVGRGRYSLLCNESGGIIDDLIVYRLADEDWLLIVNAANVANDFAWLEGLGHAAADLVDQSDDFGLLAVQGPRSTEILVDLLPEAAERLGALRYYACGRFEWAGAPLLVSRTGYTGDLGYELLVEAGRAAELWDRLLAVGGPRGLGPVGLGARDTLRLEAGFCLHGHDISLDHNPIEAGLERFVRFDKGPFIGRQALAEVAAAGPSQKLVGLLALDRGVLRAGCPVLARGESVGQVTSGTFAPSLEGSVALAYVRSELAAPHNELAVEVRGRAVACRVSALPFWRRPA